LSVETLRSSVGSLGSRAGSGGVRWGRLAAGLGLGWATALASLPAASDPGEPPHAGRERARSPFPTPDRLEDLTEKPLPEDTFDQDVAAVERWTLQGPFPDVAAAVPYRESSDWGGLLEAEATRRAGLVVPTEALHCAAREWGRFYFEKGAGPGPNLAAWIAGRCSASTPQISYHHFEGGIPADASDSEVFEAWRPAVESLLKENLVGGPRTAGIWFGRHENRAIAVVASGERLLHLQPLATVLEGDGSFVVRGELLIEAGDVSAAVNRGRYGIDKCQRDAAVRLPRFAFRCQTDPKDRESWLSVTTTPPGRLLGRGALGVVLFPSGEPGAVWKRPSLGEHVVVGPGTDVSREITRLVNRIRKDAGLEPLELSQPQTEVAQKLAPYYFATAFGLGPDGAGDLVVLGLLAGWNVEGMVESGNFASSWVMQSLDLDRLVATALQYPSGRQALLAPEARRLAVGSVVRNDPPFVAGIFGTYAIFQEASHDEAARRVLEALDAARAARGKRPARILTQVASLGRLAAARVQGGEKAPDVLNDLLRQSSQILRRSVNGWFVDARDLGQIAFPEDLLERDEVEVAVGVSHHQPSGEAWGRYVVLIVAAGPEGRGA